MEAQMLLRSQSKIIDKEVIIKSLTRKNGEFILTFCSSAHEASRNITSDVFYVIVYI
jgi:hypothetical protein